MKTFLRRGTLAVTLGLASLLVGCAGHSSSFTQRARAHDFEVVETSTNRTLNAKEMAVLRAKVEDYLDKQGATASGNYYVKVFLGADQEGAPAEWVVVRFSRDMDLRFQLLGSDDNYYAGYPAYAAYDYYPTGYDGFSRLSFQYYDEPYYGGGYTFPPQRRDNHDRNRNRDGDHDRTKDRDHEGDRNRNSDHPQPQDPPHSTPGNQVQPPPQVTHTRWDHDAQGQNNPPHDDGRGHFSGSSGRPQTDHTPERSFSPPFRTSSQAAPRTDSSSSPSSPSQSSFRTSSQAAPSTTPPPTRSESSQVSRTNQGPHDSNRAAAQREKME